VQGIARDGEGKAVAAPNVAEPVVIGPSKSARRGPFARLSLGHLIMMVAGLLAVAVNLSLLSQRDDLWSVAVAASDLPSGSAVAADDFLMTEVRVDPDVLDQLVTEDRLGEIAGSVTTRSLQAGDLVTAADLAAPSAPHELRAMSIPIDPTRAVGGAIRTGDRVDVIAAGDGRAGYVLTGAEVLAVGSPSGGAFAGPRDFFITVAVDDGGALRLAAALDDATVTVVRSTGAPEPAQSAYEPTSGESP
jgi:Flp pilus assembly protein CpaB